jgi:Protein of unknown function (DUF2510)
VVAVGSGSVSGGLGSSAAVVFFLVIIGITVGSVAMLVVALVDMVRRPDWQWRLAGQEKVLWVLLVVLVNFLAVTSLIYWFVIRKKLVAVELAAASGQLGAGYMTYGGWQPDPYPPQGFVPPGWHPDPSGQHRLRWWDGTRWTEHAWSGAPAEPAPGPTTRGTAGR